jgi:hypothetical protein
MLPPEYFPGIRYQFVSNYTESFNQMSVVCRKQISDLKFRVSAFIAMRLYWENVDKPHNKQIQSDAARAAPLIWALAGAYQ